MCIYEHEIVLCVNELILEFVNCFELIIFLDHLAVVNPHRYMSEWFMFKSLIGCLLIDFQKSFECL